MLKMIIVLFVILTFLHIQAQAYTTDFDGSESISFTSPQVPFFKSPQSLFPSGSTSIENLEKNQLGHTLKPELFYKYKDSLLSKNEIKPLFPSHISQSVIDPKTGQRWSVLEAKVDRVLTYNSKSKATMEFNIDDVSADPYDMGFTLTLKDTFLKNEPSDHAETLTTVPGGLRLSVLNYKNGFAQVSYKSYVGFVSVTELITKFDFASYVFANKKWNLVKSRSFDYMVTADNKKIHLTEITGLVTPDRIGLIASKNQKVPLWSRVEQIVKNKTAWIQSSIKGQGLIWWRPSEISSEKILGIDDILKKDIASISFHPKNPLKAIVSAHGVFMTEDGYHWKEIKNFKNFHGPVHYFNDLMIFIGHYRSTDQGKTFENYIQLDKLTSAIESQYGFLPKKLQVKKIDTLPPYQIKIEIETGQRRIQMQSPLFAQSWMATKI